MALRASTIDNGEQMVRKLWKHGGKMVKTLSNQGKQYAGKYNVSYNISDLPNGIYIAALSTDENKVSAKIVLTK